VRILAVTNMWPTAERPRVGTFVERQVRGLEKLGLTVEPLVVDRTSGGMWAYRGAANLVQRAVGRFRPDVVHVMYGGVMSELVSGVLQDVPWVQAFCGTDLLGEQSGLLLQRLRGLVGVVCSRRSARRADQVVVKSRDLERALPPDVERTRVHVIPNGVDLELFRPLDREGCRARLGWQPGVFHVVFSTPGLADANKRLPLARAAVECLARNGIPAELHVMLEVPHLEVPVWLNAADAVLMTSHHEGSPNIVKEALACNRPVVSVDVGDVKERLDGIEGCFMAEPDPEDLARKLEAVAAGPRTVSARERMKELSIETVARRLVGVYEAAMAKKEAD